jgi:hypothetical protein
MIERLILSWLGWFVASFSEAGHDWHLHSKCYKPGLSAEDKETTKRWDEGEKVALILFLVTGFEYARTGDWRYAVAMGLLQVCLRWLWHEVWYSWFSRTPFGKMGSSHWIDRTFNRMGLGNVGNAVIVTLPAVLLTVAIWLTGGAGLAP